MTTPGAWGKAGENPKEREEGGEGEQNKKKKVTSLDWWRREAPLSLTLMPGLSAVTRGKKIRKKERGRGKRVDWLSHPSEMFYGKVRKLPLQTWQYNCMFMSMQFLPPPPLSPHRTMHATMSAKPSKRKKTKMAFSIFFRCFHYFCYFHSKWDISCIWECLHCPAHSLFHIRMQVEWWNVSRKKNKNKIK